MIQRRKSLRASTAVLNASYGEEGLLTVDTGRNDLRLFNGTQLGGFRIPNQTYLDQTFLGNGAYTLTKTGANTLLTITGSWTPASKNVNIAFSEAVITAAVFNALNAVAGNGLTGGGLLKDSPTLTLGTPSAITTTSTNAVTATSHTHAIDNTIAKSATQVIAGAGMTGGGTIAVNRTLTLGTPSSITDTSTNLASGTTHTHALDAPSIQRIIARLTFNGIGCYIFAVSTDALAHTQGDTLDGSLLKTSDANNTVGVVLATGTKWLCCGRSAASVATLWRRTL